MKLLLALLLAVLSSATASFAQIWVADQALRYQQERMVYKQWDGQKFTPQPGFLYLNPFYWLTWGLHPEYHRTDRRPLASTGPQTQRLGLVLALNNADQSYRQESDTLRATATSQIASFAGITAKADPLWLLYYRQQVRDLLVNDPTAKMDGLSPAVQRDLREEGLYDWYSHETSMLKERVEAANSADLDRGARMLAYQRLLLEYRKLQAVWTTRTASAAKNRQMSQQRSLIKEGKLVGDEWSTANDVQIAKQVLTHIQ